MSASIWGQGLTLGQVGGLLNAGSPAGGFTQMFDGATAGITVVPAVDLIYLYPFPVPGRVVTSIFARLTATGAGSAAKFAMWRNSSTGRPTGVPVLGQNAGQDTSAGLGIKSSAVASVSVTTAMYWFGTKVTGTMPAFLSINAAGGATAARVAASTAALAMGSSTAQLTGFSAPDAYANDIMTTDLTAAVFTEINASGIPIIGLGWA